MVSPLFIIMSHGAKSQVEFSLSPHNKIQSVLELSGCSNGAMNQWCNHIPGLYLMTFLRASRAISTLGKRSPCCSDSTFAV